MPDVVWIIVCKEHIILELSNGKIVEGNGMKRDCKFSSNLLIEVSLISEMLLSRCWNVFSKDTKDPPLLVRKKR